MLYLKENKSNHYFFIFSLKLRNYMLSNLKRNLLVAPVVKWVGGKRQIINELSQYLPKDGYTKYYEPFLGGAAMLFHLQPQNAVVNDVNSDLINMYQVIKDNVEDLIQELETHPNEEQHFYDVRDWDRDKEAYNERTNIQKAARLIFLNKTCYNGLFRVNNAGEFNTPFGHYVNPGIVNQPVLRAVSNYLNKNKITFLNEDFSSALNNVTKTSFVYFDPPYDPISDSSSFTGYTKGGFGREQQESLKELCDKLDKKNVKFMLSNSATAFIRDLYKDYAIHTIQAKRSVNSIASRRGLVDEVVVTNYE